MKNLSTFQIVLISIFVVAAIVGVIIFAKGFGGPSSNELPEVVIWGTFPENVMNSVIGALKQDDARFARVSYVEKDERTYDADFVNALASGNGPDLFILSEDRIVTHRDKVITIPFDTYSARTFRNTFAEAGELFVTSDGILALPFSIDPMVMYWNRDILGNKGIANPPSFWDEFFTLSPKLTERDHSSSIARSFVAFGEYRNVDHAKDILSAFILQTGNPIIGLSNSGQIVSTLTNRYDFVEPPALAALRFYTEFADPIKSVYSWNRALPRSKQAFVAGDLAIYMGFASELSSLAETNPNLNFDVAAFPRARDAERSLTLAHITGLAIPRGSRDTSAAFAVATALTEQVYSAQFSKLMGLPPIRRDLLQDIPTDIVQPVFYTSAIVAKGWLDPNPDATNGIYQRMIESTLSGRARLSEALDTADAELNDLLR
ncbi:MAG TPA: extracellular solute-binding protein [Candidatus Paceibacterota bacterium]